MLICYVASMYLQVSILIMIYYVVLTHLELLNKLWTYRRLNKIIKTS